MFMRHQQLQQNFGSLFSDKVLAPLSFQNVPAAPALSAFIKHYWYVSYRGNKPFTAKTYADASMGLEFDLDELQNSVFQGPQLSAQVNHFDKPRTLLGVRFTIGGMQHFFAGGHECWHKQIKLSDVNYPLFNHMQQALSTAKHLAIAVGLLDELFIQYLSSNSVSDVGIQNILPRLIPSYQGIQMKSLADELFISQRKLNRMFSQNIGYSPKQLCKIFRVDASRRLLSARKAANNQELIYQLGYYDQAHFIHEFSELTGDTPNQYRNRKQQQLWTD